MRVLKLAVLFISLLSLSSLIYFHASAQDESKKEYSEFQKSDEPDLPPDAEDDEKIDKEEYFRLRNEHLDMLRGFDTAKQNSRTRAVRKMEQMESELAQKRESLDEPVASPWQPLGPAPIPIGTNNAWSGRVSAIAVHPTNPNVVYVGTAQGGLYRTLNGGGTWTPLMDSALTIAIGAVAISPSDPTTVFVGTGEAGLCGSGCFIGVGLYRITNADTNPSLSGPLNRDAGNNDIFTGRAISEVIVHPFDSNIVFAASTSGVAGIGSTTTGLFLPSAGVYRTTNAMSANPTFTKLAIQGTLAASRSVTDLAIEPGNPNRLVAGVIGSGGDGGVYLSTDALAATPTFARTVTNGDGSSLGRTEFAVNKVAGVVTVYAATGTGNGTLYKSIDGGATFNPAGGGNGFCGTQCFYDIAVAVDPNDANRVYLGGNPSLVFGRSFNGGASFANSSSGLHVDTQAFAVAPSDPNIVYFGSDGGIWRTTNVTATTVPWQTLNNSTFSATQFMGLALHPTDRNYMIGGTQDNGTQYLAPNGTTWVNSDGGDGGFAVIDQNSPSTTSVTAYHTYYNQTNSQIGFSRALTTEPNGDPFWATFLGCQNGSSNNGINCADSVLFYAPMVRGPGNPNTLYFGTNKLYRSDNQGALMTPVSQQLTGNLSAIGISPQDDNLRLVGTTTGRIYASFAAGATTMVDVTGSIPARYIGRVAFDPTNANIAYVALNGYGLVNGQHVWKTTNFLSGAPTWTIAGSGIPDTPVSAFVVDPANPQTLFAGTDIGVFRSANGGASWEPFSEGLPRVAVFGMEIQGVHRVLRIATHGRGIWEKNLQVPTRRPLFDYDADGRADVSVFRPSTGVWHISNSTAGYREQQFAASGDKIVPADYDNDGKTDIAVYRPANGTWYVLRSTAGYTEQQFGEPGDVPVPADYDGDGKADFAVYRPSNGVWYLLRSQLGFTQQQFGGVDYQPVAADYDGDGKTDIAVYLPNNGVWYILRSFLGYVDFQFGGRDYRPVAADYDGDGKADIAVYLPSNGVWYMSRSQLGYGQQQFGGADYNPVPADYDGDGKTDLAVYRPANGVWYLLRSQQGYTEQQFGGTDFIPTVSAFLP